MLTSFRLLKIIKVKFILEQATKSQRGKYRYRSILYLTTVLDGVGGQRHALAALSPGKEPVPIV
jgi:hypothetical protein